MIFSEAFKYPFNNLRPVLMITVAYAVYAMILAVLFALILTNSSIITLTLILVISEVLFLSGYGLRMIRTISDGDEKAPPFEVMNDIGQGIRVVVAGIVYFLPILLISLVIGLLVLLGGGSRDGSGGLALAMLCALVFIIPLLFLLGWALQIGIVRYAVEGNGLFDYSTNISIARQNIGPGFSLFARYLLLGGIYGGFIRTVDTTYQRIVYQNIALPTHSTIVILQIIGGILSITLGIMQQFSGYHLVAQFGMIIDLGPEKPKPTDPDMDTSSDY